MPWKMTDRMQETRLELLMTTQSNRRPVRGYGGFSDMRLAFLAYRDLEGDNSYEEADASLKWPKAKAVLVSAPTALHLR